MENTDIINESFAEFLGASYNHDEKLFYFPYMMFKAGKNHFYSYELKFHNDCNWINGVIQNIKNKSLGGSMGDEINVKRIEIFKTITVFSEEEKIYNACAEFVKWYQLNSNKQ